MDDFDLTALVRDILNGTDIADTTRLADIVYSQIPKKHHAIALQQTLRVFVGNVVSLDRRSVMSSHYNSPSRSPGPDESLQTPEHVPPSNGDRVTNNGKGTGAPSTGGGFVSHHVAGTHQYWTKLMNVRLAVGPGRDESKLFGDCEREDLAYARDLRLRIAAANTAAAGKYDAADALLVQHNAKRVRDLPETVITELFQGLGPDGDPV